MNNDVFLDHACGGICACTTCHVWVKKGAENLSELDDDEARPHGHRRRPAAEFAPRMPGGDHQARRSGGRDSGVEQELRLGRKTCMLQELQVDQLQKISASCSRNSIPRPIRWQLRFTDLHKLVTELAQLQRRSQAIERSPSSKPSRWLGTRSGKTNHGGRSDLQAYALDRLRHRSFHSCTPADTAPPLPAAWD